MTTTSTTVYRHPGSDVGPSTSTIVYRHTDATPAR